MAELPNVDDWNKGNEDDVSIIKNCYCVNCHGNNGITHMLPTKVPYFREIIVMSYYCSDCYYRNTEINFGGEIQEKGERLEFYINDNNDLNRQIIKSDYGTIQIPECYNFEIPSTTQRGQVTTIEGLLKTSINNLDALQSSRLQLNDLDNFYRCRNVIQQLRLYVNDHEDNDDDNDEQHNNDNENKDEKQDHTYKINTFIPFTIIIDDPSGNSFIENPFAPGIDPHLKTIKYVRTPTQDMFLGLQPSASAIEDGKIDNNNPLHKNIVNTPMNTNTANESNTNHQISTDTDIIKKRIDQQQQEKKESDTNDNDMNTRDDIGRKEVIIFESTCPNCYKDVETNMCVVDIPHFKEVIIMSLVCESCGYKSNEIKGGGGIPKYGTKIIITITCLNDLQREILKSDTAGINIPEIELELQEGSLDGVYTTIEGLLQKLYQRLYDANPFSVGDSVTKQHTYNDIGNTYSKPNQNHIRYRTFLNKLHEMSLGTFMPFTIIIIDPLSNSFVGPIPSDAISLALQAEKDGTNVCYDNYIDPNMQIIEFERTYEQDETLGLNDMKTENYDHQLQLQQQQLDHNNADKIITEDNNNNNNNSSGDNNNHSRYYGTDQMEELPDRLRRVDIRGPDHPHMVGKAPVDGDNTIMGPGSIQFAVPSIGQRGTTATGNNENNTNTNNNDLSSTEENNTTIINLQKMIREYENNDPNFMMNDRYDGNKVNMIFKDGAQGIGYYTDIPLLERTMGSN